MKKIWFDEAWEDYMYWQMQDKKTLKRINSLIKDIERNGYQGIGKSEPLKGDLQGYWSKRIDNVNRLVFRIHEGILEIISCKGHYDDQFCMSIVEPKFGFIMGIFFPFQQRVIRPFFLLKALTQMLNFPAFLTGANALSTRGPVFSATSGLS